MKTNGNKSVYISPQVTCRVVEMEHSLLAHSIILDDQVVEIIPQEIDNRETYDTWFSAPW